ncbi:potassium channel family protein [Halomonas sp.]|uniref:potassium channel family protein n=1 Tax=Halomonas sp. TaxID=1486246 RepID=UPI0025BBA0E4|nr:potassium channel family protein [Halomonas sp.]
MRLCTPFTLFHSPIQEIDGESLCILKNHGSAVIAIILSALALVAITVLIHVVSLALLVRWVDGLGLSRVQRLDFWPLIWLFVRIVWALLFSHSTQISIWAWFYLWKGAMTDWDAALYFSGVTYTTIGYGDLLLDPPGRIMATIEGLTGILMCSLSAAFFFSVMVQLFFRRQINNGATDVSRHSSRNWGE